MYTKTPHLDFAKFQDTSRISPSSLKQFDECPYYYWAKRVAEFWEDEDNENFTLGKGADSLITIGQDHFDTHYKTVPRRTAQLKEDAKKLKCCSEDCRDGVILLAPKQEETIIAMKKELERQPLYEKFTGGLWDNQAFLECDIVDEFDNSSIFAVGKMDYYHKKAQVIADLKTCANLDTFHPAMYALQMGMYHEIAKIVDGINAQIFIIAVDKTDMTRSRIFMISDTIINEGKARMRRAIERLKACRESNGWGDIEIDDSKPHSCATYDTCPYAIQKRIFIV